MTSAGEEPGQIEPSGGEGCVLSVECVKLEGGKKEKDKTNKLKAKSTR
jgi:hypothetical protein